MSSSAGRALAGGVGLTTNGTCGALSGGVIALCCKYGQTHENFAKGRYLKSYQLWEEIVYCIYIHMNSFDLIRKLKSCR
jgi:hypothetical protein